MKRLEAIAINATFVVAFFILVLDIFYWIPQ